MQDFKKLEVWRKAHELTLDVYRATESFPRTEVYGLTTQLRRSCSSIPANIAEGCGRGTNGDLGRFLRIAAGSASELEYHRSWPGIWSSSMSPPMSTSRTE